MLQKNTLDTADDKAFLYHHGLCGIYKLVLSISWPVQNAYLVSTVWNVYD